MSYNIADHYVDVRYVAPHEASVWCYTVLEVEEWRHLVHRTVEGQKEDREQERRESRGSVEEKGNRTLAARIIPEKSIQREEHRTGEKEITMNAHQIPGSGDRLTLRLY